MTRLTAINAPVVTMMIASVSDTAAHSFIGVARRTVNSVIKGEAMIAAE